MPQWFFALFASPGLFLDPRLELKDGMFAVSKVADRLPGSLFLRVTNPLDEVVGHFVELSSLQNLLNLPFLITLHLLYYYKSIDYYLQYTYRDKIITINHHHSSEFQCICEIVEFIHQFLLLLSQTVHMGVYFLVIFVSSDTH